MIPKKSHLQSEITISKWHVTDNNIRSDEEPTLKASALEILFCGQFVLSTQLIKTQIVQNSILSPQFQSKLNALNLIEASTSTEM